MLIIKNRIELHNIAKYVTVIEYLKKQLIDTNKIADNA
jgi:hypothetical protein